MEGEGWGGKGRVEEGSEKWEGKERMRGEGGEYRGEGIKKGSLRAHRRGACIHSEILKIRQPVGVSLILSYKHSRV